MIRVVGCAALIQAEQPPEQIASTSVRGSLVLLGTAAIMITLLCGIALRGLDRLSARRAVPPSRSCSAK